MVGARVLSSLAKSLLCQESVYLRKPQYWHFKAFLFYPCFALISLVAVPHSLTCLGPLSCAYSTSVSVSCCLAFTSLTQKPEQEQSCPENLGRFLSRAAGGLHVKLMLLAGP